MKYILVIIFFTSVIPSNLIASDNIFKSNFYTIDIENQMISDAKIKEINKIKILTLDSILKKILTKTNFKKLKRLINTNANIDYYIKNIIIEDEFISLNKYSANIKINFDKNEIIQLLRNNKINYTDYISPKILVIYSIQNELLQEGLSKDNFFYTHTNNQLFDLMNLTYPDLSPNDRFIIPYRKIILKDLKSLKKISKKYDVSHVIIINYKKNLSNTEYNLSVYTFYSNELTDIAKIKNSFSINDVDKIMDIYSNWWKENNIIDNSKINKISCLIKNNNIHELHYIKNLLINFTQIKSITLMNISLGSNLYDIYYYGDLINISNKLVNEKIILKFDTDNECIISN